jgi:ribosomal protein S18 acetylase RimI-like enzyme
MIVIGKATDGDYAYLSQNDRHITPTVLKRKLEDGEIFVARQDTMPIGWLRYGLFWDSIPFMNMLFVSETKRGMGVGTQLVSYWETQMRLADHKMVMTSTLSNETAQHFYRKLGYRDAGALLLLNEPLEILLLKTLTD